MGADGAGGGSNESRLSEHSRTKRPPKSGFRITHFFGLEESKSMWTREARTHEKMGAGHYATT